MWCVSLTVCMRILNSSVCRERRSALMKWFRGLQAWFHKTAQEGSLIWSLSSWLCGHLGLPQGLGLGQTWTACSVVPVRVGGHSSDRLWCGRTWVVCGFLVKEHGSPSGLRTLCENRQLP